MFHSFACSGFCGFPTPEPSSTVPTLFLGSKKEYEAKNYDDYKAYENERRHKHPVGPSTKILHESTGRLFNGQVADCTIFTIGFVAR